MRFKPNKTSIILISILLASLVIPASFASNYNRTYNCDVQYGLDNHKLYTSTPPSLYDYYRGETHSLNNEKDYSKFVTPNAVKPVAEIIRNITSNSRDNDEEFANAVLMLIHQIPYAETDIKYPVETIADNSGDCDTLSLLAASIMKAGNLDIVLFYYKNAGHMNIGVNLPNTPYSPWWTSPTSYEYDGKEYWMAECTPKAEWKVGDQPESLTNEKPLIISLENCEKSSPAQISASLDNPLTPSSATINISSNPSSINYGERNLTISGTITPNYQEQNITIYISQDKITYNNYQTQTDSTGNYSFAWNFTATGTYYITASWSGTSNYASADSETLTVFIGFPKSLIQYETDDYDYILGSPGAGNYELRIRQGVKEFLEIHLPGNDILLAGEFIILKSGQTTSIKQAPTIPKGKQPLKLPDNLTKNDQFCLIIGRNDENGYNVNVKALDDYDVSQIPELDGNTATFMNASIRIRENTWYKIVAKMSENEITAELRDMNGTLLESMAIENESAGISEIGILMANNTDRAIAFKNLKVENLNQSIQPLNDSPTEVNTTDLLAPYINLTIALAATIAAVVYVQKRKNGKTHPPSFKEYLIEQQ